MEKIRPALRPDIQAAVQPLIDEARAKGYAAGLEAAAKWHDSMYTDIDVNKSIENKSMQIHHQVSAKAIRALGKEGT